MAAIAARTRRVRIGTGVLLPALRRPVVLAHLVATVDRLAEGRVILGVSIVGDSPATRKEFTHVGGRDGAGAPADPGRRAPVERTDQVVSRHPGQRVHD
jgi:alkanesulfonate monooxygenase SsuD/methylene tetrahydromethanopterin reductase-like flavin-dependent oxidoreductase (luciferase family)